MVFLSLEANAGKYLEICHIQLPNLYLSQVMIVFLSHLTLQMKQRRRMS
jgi:hypothetical protein